MELLIGPSLALIASMFFNVVSAKKTELKVSELQERVEKLDKAVAAIDQSTATKLAQAVVPVAQAVRRLNDQVGI